MIQDPTAPKSAPNVLNFKFNPATNVGGGDPTIIFTPQQELYYAFWWKTSDPFISPYNHGNNKVAFTWSTNQAVGQQVWELYAVNGADGLTGPYTFGVMIENGGLLNNCHLGNGYGDCPGSYNLFPNKGAGAIQTGQWHLIEIYLKASSSRTAQDGTIRWWVDGALAGDYTNASLGEVGWDSVNITPAWDGSPARPGAAETNHYYDHMRVSAPCPGGCEIIDFGGTNPPGTQGTTTGGSTTTPPATDDCTTTASGGTSVRPRPAIAPNSGNWPNEPPGSTPLLDCDFSDALCGGQLYDVYGSAHTTTQADAPYSPTSVFEDFMAAGRSVGGSQAGFDLGSGLNEIYGAFYWKMNATFQGGYPQNATHKLFFVNNSESDYWLSLFTFHNWTPGPTPENEYVVAWSPDTTPLSQANAHLPNTYDLSHYGNSCHVFRDQWYLFEYYIKTSTTASSNDGVVRWWINGQICGDYTNANFPGKIVTAWETNHTWDGGLGPRSADSAHWYDHLYISAPNCPNGCPLTGTADGGGTTGCAPKTCDTFELYEFPPDCTPSAGTFSPTGEYGPHWTLSKQELDSLTVSCKPGFCGTIEFIVVPKQTW